MAMVLSANQYTMLKSIKAHPGAYSRTEASEYLQPTYSSMVRRGYLVYDKRDGGFIITPTANAAILEFENAQIHRQSTLRGSGELSNFLESYIDRQIRSKSSSRNGRRRSVA